MKKNSSKKSLCVLLIFWCSMGFVPMAFADIYSDVAHMASDLAKMTDIQGQMHELQEQSTPDISSIKSFSEDVSGWTEEQKSQWASLTKAYDMGSHLYTPNAFEFDSNSRYTELWSADSWDDALKAASGGNSSRYQELKAAYASKNPTLTSASSAIDSVELVKNSYTQKADVTNTALSAGQYTYEDINQRIRNLKDLLAMIDDPSKNSNEKAALDLNTRMQAEVGLIQVEMLRLQSIQAQMQASGMQDDVNHETIEKQLLGYDINQ